MKELFFFLSCICFSIPLKTKGQVSGKTDKRPNILIIMADDMGYSDIGCYGGEINTPNLDALAVKGIKMRSFYNNARCCPTRASLLTGQYPHTVGIGNMVSQANAKVEPGPYQGFLSKDFSTIASQLKKLGYNTYMSGKWHVGENQAYWPMKFGFDHYYGLISGASSFYEITPQERQKRKFVQDDQEIELPKEGFYMTDALTDKAIEYVNLQKSAQAQNPFLLYLAYTAPHFPLHALEQDIAKYESLYLQGWDKTRKLRFEKMKKLGLVNSRYDLTEKTTGIPDWEIADDKFQWARKMAVYAAMIDRMDQNIGRLIAQLKKNGQYENTFIVFISDNGGCAETVNTRLLNDSSKKIGERGSYAIYGEPWANVSNTPFKKYKHFMHEGGIITPCIVQWPAGIKPRPGYTEGIGHVIDLLPTSLELAGSYAEDLPGQSLSYLWKGKNNTERTYCWEHEGNLAIRKGNWKLVKELSDPDWQLFDMKNDPTETRDLSLQNPSLKKNLLDEYLVWSLKMGVRPFKTSGKGE